MKFLAISGSARRASTNTAMLYALQSVAGSTHTVSVYDRVGELPVFSPDLELPEPRLK
ncbi:NAD(P)H-dependent FMN reductase [Rhizobium pisi]|uniref:NAD(P)H-dependent FMN reductase n=1 Tax=Rhizobium pisi TaxID=574561 RepID=A0A7W5BJ81_9HYPH|nr:NAD(P)H-dependent FMN reductase [Rhizobium pisi]